ncbi:Protein RCC2-like protein [Psilocybe cubensis]|uniref:Protein RCC2-like protein n=1 Tax=Psilocybe cubensis TaxID=181762 RepID=A0ACB8GTR7_PSICU|nr:Protein RCC2-like protein [Psilocybe cubensis]KAH9479125.1 Protein RCC2-like protein [Psilocybe cubensis]
MVDDAQGELQTVPSSHLPGLVEVKIKASPTTRKRTRKDNLGEERPKKRVKIKEFTSTAEHDPLNTNGSVEGNPKKRGRSSKASLTGKGPATYAELDDSDENDDRETPKKKKRSSKVLLKDSVAGSATNSPKKEPAEPGQTKKRGRPAKSVAEVGNNKPKESPKKKGKGTKGNETKEQPRIWFGSEAELRSTLPELTGSTCINGLSWEYYQTPILLLDDANKAFQVTHDDADVGFVDLVTTRSFVHGTPKKPQTNIITDPTPTHSTPKEKPIVHELPQPTQDISIPTPIPETEPTAIIIKKEEELYRFSMEPDGMTSMDVSMDQSQCIPAQKIHPGSTEESEPPLPSLSPRPAHSVHVAPQVYHHNYVLNSNPHIQLNACHDTPWPGIPMTPYQKLPLTMPTDEPQSSGRIKFTDAPLPMYTSSTSSSLKSNPYKALATSSNHWGIPFQSGIMPYGQFSPMTPPAGRVWIPLHNTPVQSLYPITTAGQVPPGEDKSQASLPRPLPLPSTSLKQVPRNVAGDQATVSLPQNEGHGLTKSGQDLESNPPINLPGGVKVSAPDTKTVHEPINTDVEIDGGLIPEVGSEEPLLSELIEEPAQEVFGTIRGQSCGGHSHQEDAQEVAENGAEPSQKTCSKHPPESSQETQAAIAPEGSRAAASVQASVADKSPISEQISEPILTVEAGETSETANQTSDTLQNDPLVIPTTLPTEVQMIIDCYISGTPLTLIASYGHLLNRWSLRLKRDAAYAMMGYFRIVGIQETLLEPSDGDRQQGEQQSVSGQVKWLFRLQWRPGGEEFIMPDTDPLTLEYPWWVQRLDLNKDEKTELEEQNSPDKESLAEATQTPSDPEDDYPTTPKYRQARVTNHEYEFRHDHYRLIYESLLPISLLAPFGPFVLDSGFPRGWLCANCGRVNYQAALRHRICGSSSCKDKPPSAEPYKVELFSMRDPQDRLPIAQPYDIWPKSVEPKVIRHENGVQTITYPLDDSGTASIKHVFLGNFEELQKQATTLLDKIQLQVELKRPFNDSSKAPKTMQDPTTEAWPKVPDCINEAKASLSSARFLFGLEDSRISVNRLTVLAWITAGVRKGPEILRAKEKCVVIVAFGCDIVMTLTSRSIESLSAAQKLPKINGDSSGNLISDLTHSVNLDEPTVQAPATLPKVKKSIKAAKSSLTLYLVHGDCVVLDGDDFEYSIKRDGTSFLLICGGTDWPKLGRKDRGGASGGEHVERENPDLLEPFLLRSLLNVKAVSAYTSCAGCHFVVLDIEGNAWLFGRNGFGCLGVPDVEYISENAPRLVKATDLGAPKGTKFVHAACGRNHTLLVGSDGTVWAAGQNNLGQCGQSICPEVSSFQSVSVSHGGKKEHVIQASAGITFSIVLTKSGKVFSFGSAEKGQLGNGTTGERITTGNKTSYDIETQPVYVKELDGKKIVRIVSGQQHSLALDSAGVVYVWGYNGYCRLGLGNQVDVLKPKVVPQFAGPNEMTMACDIVAGPSNSVVVDNQKMYWMAGKWKNSGEGSSGSPFSTFRYMQDIMTCKVILARAGGVTHWLVTPDDDGTPMTVCWGQNANNGELGLGPEERKSASKPTRNLMLVGIDVFDIAAGQNTTVLLAKPNEKFSDMPRHPEDVSPPLLCVGCNKDEGEDDNPLECDKCDAPWHLKCLNPPLDAVPDGEWFCPDCEDDPGAPVGKWAVKKTKTAKPKAKRAGSPASDDGSQDGGVKRKDPPKTKTGAAPAAKKKKQ